MRWTSGNTISQVATMWRPKLRNHETLSDEQVAVRYFSQLAANAGVSFPIWRADIDFLPPELEEVARRGFYEFSQGFIGV